MNGLIEAKSEKLHKKLFVTNFSRYCAKSGHFDTQLNNRNPASNGGVFAIIGMWYGLAFMLFWE